MNLKFLYTTDLHGNIQKYEDVLVYAKEYDIKLIHLGADILPKGKGMLKEQKKFIKGYLKNFYDECKREGIKVLAFFGNDDLFTRKKYFRKYAELLDEVLYRRDGHTFKAYGFVSDHCFNLKNGCKLDDKNSKPEEIRPQYVLQSFYERMIKVPITPESVDVGEDGFYVIKDPEKYFKNKGTIKDDLNKIRAGSKTIIAIHGPPCSVNLDVCNDFNRVGSRSVLHWIEEKQPLLVLCGHIHETYEVTRSWKTYIGKTLVIQPGQMEKQTTMVHIEIKDDQVEADLVMDVKNKS